MLIGKISRRFARISFLLVLGAALAVTGFHAMAQSNFGSIVGAVADPTGAAGPGAQVTLVNAGTNATESTTTGPGGNYTFLNLNPGSYTVKVAMAGFKGIT